MFFSSSKDNIVSVDMVLANGTLLEGVTAATHPDLFWATRGPSRAQSASVLGSWVKPYGTRLGMRKGGKGAVRLPKILVLASLAVQPHNPRPALCGAYS